MDAARQKEMCDSLIQWFATLQLSAPHRTALELSDGVAMAQALHQLAPDTFTGAWLAKIKFEVGSNWRLKVSNLKKVSAGSMEYYADCLQLQLAYFRPPDVLAIAEKQDHRELGVLLQLVLGCAVNCPDKQDYITAIMGLEESLQRNIMTALQQLETVWQGARSAASPSSGQRTSLNVGSSSVGGSATSSSGSAAALDTLTGAAAGSAAGSGGVRGDGGEQHQLQLSADRADVLAQRCHEAERRVALLLDEKCTLQQEVAKMQEELDRGALHAGGGLHAVAAIGDDGVSLGPVQPGSTRYTELRRQLDAMKDELLMAETQRDDFKIRAAQQEKEMVGLQQRVDELSKTADELVTVKDEMDALRESADRLKVCEAQLVTFKKKLEEYNDLRRQVKQLEERSAEYLQQNAVQEEQLKKSAALKGQVELYKLEIAELHGKLDAEMMRSVKTEFELSNAAARCAALQRETDGLLLERDQLRETCDELRCTQMRPAEGGIDGGGAETMRTAMLRGGEIQKKKMKERDGGESGQDGDGGEVGAETSEEHRAFLAQFMDESNQRIEKLREQLKVANQRILFHEAQATAAGSLEAAAVAGQDAVVLQQLKLALEQNERKATQLDDAHTNLAQHEHKIAHLEAALLAREQELAAADARHRKSVEKTKEIIQSYDPKLAGDYSLSDKSTGLDNGNEPTLPVRPPIDSVEERLMGTAFYRLSQSCHRDAMEARLALLNGAGQSFLNRQRQPAARKSQNGGGGGGVGVGVTPPFKK